MAWNVADDRRRDPEVTASYHRWCPLPEGASAADAVDDGTWRDLDLDAISAGLDRTETVAGECVLHRFLRLPIGATVELDQRRRAARALDGDTENRERVLAALRLAPRRWINGLDLVRLVWGEPPSESAASWRYSAMMAALLAATAAAVATLSLGWFVVALVMFVANAATHAHIVESSGGRLSAMRQLRGLLLCARRLHAVAHPDMAPARHQLEAALQQTRPIERRLGWMLHNSALGANYATEIVFDYVNQFLLLEVQLYFSLLPLLRERREAVQSAFQAVGSFDAWQALASHRRAERDWCEAEMDAAGPVLEINGARHPLLDRPVPNSLNLRTAGAVITGSNMSGKTTFLRVIAVNALLAQTIGRCPADRYRGRRLRIFSLLDQSDDLSTGTSYYLATAKRMRTLVRLAESATLVLGLVDEPLEGTNSSERFAAAAAILRYVAERSGRVLVTTHDLGLARILEDSTHFTSFHFSDYADAGGMRFDYTLHPGLAYHANAIAVLEMLGFPAAITAAARQASERPRPPDPDNSCR